MNPMAISGTAYGYVHFSSYSILQRQLVRIDLGRIVTHEANEIVDYINQEYAD